MTMIQPILERFVANTAGRWSLRQCRRPGVALIGVTALMLAGCTTAAPGSPSAERPSPSVAATRTPIPSPTPLPGMPTELVGGWGTDLRDFLDPEDICSPCGPEVRLIIRAHGSWTVARAGGQASGSFSIEDGQLVFGPSTACEGMGTYEWESDGDTLTLTAVQEDECERRQEALDGPTYTRED
jgi:hypothetical protein